MRLKNCGSVLFSIIYIFSSYNLTEGEDSKPAILLPLNANYDAFLWRIHNANRSYDLDASVPGGAHTSLMHNANIGDPYYRFRDVEYQWIVYDNWTFYRNFSLKDEVFERNSLVLVANGLDTIADVHINGKFVGHSDNMFHRHEWDIRSQVKRGLNNITISFTSAPMYALNQSTSYSYDVPPDCPAKVQNGFCHVNFMRKEQCSFSWDWGPAFAPQGIWRNLTIMAFDAAVIQDVLAIPISNFDYTSWKLNVTVYFSVGTIPAHDHVSVRISVVCPFEMIADVPINITRGKPYYNIMLGDFTLKNDNLWWPHGFGKQSLYQLNVTLRNSQFDTLSNKSIKFGFRKVELIQEAIEESPGLSFYFKVTGRPIFIKGSNWIPADAFQERITPAYLRYLLQSVVDANMHALRVWGGGVYEQDVFYEICDELGIVLWQDIMFGCAMYPTNKEFIDSVQREVMLQVRRIGHHPSLLIWAGNNENEAALRQDWYGTEKHFSMYKDDYIKLYVDTVREEMIYHATNIPFVSSSPSNGVETETSGWVALNPQDTHYGDVHYYNYKADCWDVTNFPKPRFASEYGFQSWPSIESIKQVSIQDDWDFGSNFSSHRQHHDTGNLEMLDMILKHFNTSQRQNFEEAFHDMIYLTQISQALCIKSETEHYRRLQSLMVKGEGHCMGALYWQLNDIWQAPTWSSIEYGGNWKMLHYFAKDFFAPILASGMEQNGTLFVYTITDAEDLTDAMLVVTLRKWSSMTYKHTWNTTFSQDFFAPVLTSGVEHNGTLFVYTVTDAEELTDATLVVSLRKWSSMTYKHAWNTTCSQKAPSSQLVFQKDVKSLLSDGDCDDRNACFLTFDILHKGDSLSPTNAFYLSSFKTAVGLKKPVIQVLHVTQPSKDIFRINLQTTNIAPFTWLKVTQLPLSSDHTNPTYGRFSNNGFLFLDPVVTIDFYISQEIPLKYFTQALSVTTLMDLYL